MNDSIPMNDDLPIYKPTAEEREERQNYRIRTLERAVDEVIQALHSNAKECCQCALNGTSVCYGHGDTAEIISEFVEDEGGCEDD